MTFDTWSDRSYSADSEEAKSIYVLWEAGEGGYDWWIEALIAKRFGDEVRYAVYSDSGCSCSSEFEDEPTGFLFDPNLDRVIGGMCEDLRGSSEWRMGPDQKVSEVASLKQFAQKIRKGEVTIP